ncbi:uncharacterized protein ACO6RY_18096 [Pungitius sinensis]
MDAWDSSLPESINPNNFPAKLWRLVNNPVNQAICWDREGFVVVIDQHLFEEQILSPSSSSASDNKDVFKTTNFSSFVRQLNLYGFKKADANMRDCHADQPQFHYFYNPNFKRNHPELVTSLQRLTVHNKAKIQAGLEVKNRGSSKYLRYSGDGLDKDVKREFLGDCPTQRHTHKESTYPYPPNKAQAAPAHNGTPVPPRFLTRGHGAALSPSVFAANKGIPVSLSPNYTGAASSSNAVLHPQGLLTCSNCGNPNFPYNLQFQPGYYSPLYSCYHQNLVASQMASSGLQNSSFPTQRHYQASCLVNTLGGGDNNLDSKNKEHQEVKKCNINMDSIFQIADEMMQTRPNSSLIRVVTPDKPGALSVPLSASNNNIIIASVTGSADLFAQQELSGNTQPEQKLKDAILEVTKVTIDDAKD